MADRRQTIREANQLAKAGKREEAQKLLADLLQNDPRDAGAWWAFANATTSPTKQRLALERVLLLQPDHLLARQRLATLDAAPAAMLTETAAKETAQVIADMPPAPPYSAMHSPTRGTYLALIAAVSAILVLAAIVVLVSINRANTLAQDQIAMEQQAAAATVTSGAVLAQSGATQNALNAQATTTAAVRELAVSATVAGNQTLEMQTRAVDAIWLTAEANAAQTITAVMQTLAPRLTPSIMPTSAPTLTPTAEISIAALPENAGTRELARFVHRAANDQPEAISHLAFSADGRSLATGSGTFVRLWDANSGTMLAAFGSTSERLRYLFFSTDSSVLGTIVTYAFPAPSRLLLREARTGASLDVANQAPFISAPYFGADGVTLSGLTTSGVLNLNLTEGTAEEIPISGTPEAGRTAEAGRAPWESEADFVIVSPNGQYAAGVALDQRGIVKLWDVRRGALLGTLSFDPDAAHANLADRLIFSPDGTMLALAVELDQVGRIYLWDTTSRQVVGRPIAHPAPLTAAVFSPDSRTLAFGSRDGSATLLDIPTRRVLVQLQVANEGTDITKLAFNGDGWLLAAAFGEYVRVWDTAPYIIAFDGAPIPRSPTLADQLESSQR